MKKTSAKQSCAKPRNLQLSKMPSFFCKTGKSTLKEEVYRLEEAFSREGGACLYDADTHACNADGCVRYENHWNPCDTEAEVVDFSGKNG